MHATLGQVFSVCCHAISEPSFLFRTGPRPQLTLAHTCSPFWPLCCYPSVWKPPQVFLNGVYNYKRHFVFFNLKPDPIAGPVQLSFDFGFWVVSRESGQRLFLLEASNSYLCCFEVDFDLWSLSLSNLGIRGLKTSSTDGFHSQASGEKPKMFCQTDTCA